MNTREQGRDRERARRWWSSLERAERSRLGDELVLGIVDWLDWGFAVRPSSAFRDEVDAERLRWESHA